jgi:hypothetical protein
MAPTNIVKSKDKLTDSEKKKIKAGNKAKANPGKSEEKKEKNIERRFRRGQDERPEAIKEKEEAKQRASEKAEKDKAKAEMVKLAEADKLLKKAADKQKKAKEALTNQIKEGVADATDAAEEDGVIVEREN